MSITLIKKEKVIKEVKYLNVCAKCSDCFSGDLLDSQGNIVHDYDGYVPSGLGIGRGDYVEFKVDLETGQILNWKKPEDIIIEDND